MSASALPRLILLAGTSEAGKSTAGQHLAHLGAKRVKIRSLLLTLSTGTEVVHERVATREGFEHHEFVTSLQELAAATSEPVIVVESFIDAQLAILTRTSWPTENVVVFITAPQEMRVHRHADANALAYEQSDRIVRAKDARKRVAEQLGTWRQVADHWIDNDGPPFAFNDALDGIMASILPSTNEPHR